MIDQDVLVQQLRALGEPTRLEVARLLALREWGAAELLDQVSVSQPSLSRHLKLLREAGIIRERREGRNVYYLLENNVLTKDLLEATGLIELSASKHEMKSMHKNQI